MRSKRAAGRKETRADGVLRRAASLMEVPLPGLCPAPRMELFGDREFSMEGASGIVDYCEEQVCIAAAGALVRLLGSGLTIVLYNDRCITIEGRILSVEFLS